MDAIAGVALAIGTSFLIPGLRLIVAGLISSGLAGAGGITSEIIGALVGSGFPEECAKMYETGFKDGHIALGVHPRNDEDAKYFENKWRKNQGEEIHN